VQSYEQQTAQAFGPQMEQAWAGTDDYGNYIGTSSGDFKTGGPMLDYGGTDVNVGPLENVTGVNAPYSSYSNPIYNYGI
jgi:hypothetical protein